MTDERFHPERSLLRLSLKKSPELSGLNACE